jgi:hypothetical protein
MANGDAAAAQGFTPVAPAEDFRLGYDGINRAADFAATRVRYYTANSATAQAALQGMKRGDRCWRSDESIEYAYWTSWREWDSDYRAYSVTDQTNVAWSNFIASFRWNNGRVLVKWLAQGLAGANSGSGEAVHYNIPIAAALNGDTKPFSRLRCIKSGVGEFPVDVEFMNATTVKMQFHTGNPVRAQDVSAQQPFGWGSGDLILGSFEYDRG